MRQNPQYLTGYLLGKRAGQRGEKPEPVSFRSPDFQKGYSDGYHIGTGGLVL